MVSVLSVILQKLASMLFVMHLLLVSYYNNLLSKSCNWQVLQFVFLGTVVLFEAQNGAKMVLILAS